MHTFGQGDSYLLEIRLGVNAVRSAMQASAIACLSLLNGIPTNRPALR
jgi:hypothetical protein